jgi:hypothetical protein
MKAQIINTNADVRSVRPKKDNVFNLKELQGFVGGYIQIVKTRDSRMMIINEEGKVNGLPYNEIATSLYIYGNHDPIMGDVVVLDKEMIS